jgi:hypothetical protein
VHAPELAPVAFVTVRTCKKQGVDCKPEVRHIHRRRTPIPVKDGSSVDQRLAEDEYCGFIFLMRTCNRGRNSAST